MKEWIAKIDQTAEYLKGKTTVRPQLGIILGTGLGGLVKEIEVADTISYDQIFNFPISTVESHAGRLIFGKLSGKDVMVMQGRFHYYEGYTMQQITFPVRVMKALGARAMLVSNACGGVNPVYAAGDIMLMADHINFMGDNPLLDRNEDTLGPRFPDMYNAYDRDLMALAEKVALEQRVKLQKGVYMAFSGPNLETAAEYRMARAMGADVVGMSSVPEVIVARHAGLKVLGLSIITDMGLPDALEPASLEKILKAAGKTEPAFVRLVAQIVKEMPF
ncbi:MAG TPA: purine-nucleoside phosphorylase [Candidatus Edwardsbacteria bacterium]|nr:purine-nucleoside phosphorylase [Candidatus Edwardsbacteria bacterium]